MFQKWEIGDKKGNIVFPKGEVVYQTKGVVIETVYKTEDGKCYILDIEEKLTDIEGEKYIKVDDRQFTEINGQKFIAITSGKLLEIIMNPYNGYYYRQDGK